MGVRRLKAAVFLDRDGVLNKAVVRNGKPYPPRSAEEMEIVPGAAEALAALRGAGFELIVVTNQPDVARGAASVSDVERVNEALERQLPLDKFYVCYHDDADDCHCRKPKGGLITDAARDEGIDLASSYMVGDRWRDIAAGKAAGVTTILIENDYQEMAADAPDYRATSITKAAEWILSSPMK